jgi:hypothetical protein
MDNSKIVGEQISKLMKNGQNEVDHQTGSTDLYPELGDRNQSGLGVKKRFETDTSNRSLEI